MSKPKIKLRVGQIWGVLPVEKTLETRTIDAIWPLSHKQMSYSDIGIHDWQITITAFRAWVKRKKAVLIGHYDFKTGKAIAKK